MTPAFRSKWFDFSPETAPKGTAETAQSPLDGLGGSLPPLSGEKSGPPELNKFNTIEKRQPAPVVCYACHRADFWRLEVIRYTDGTSAPGPWLCGRCHPPASEEGMERFATSWNSQTVQSWHK